MKRKTTARRPGVSAAARRTDSAAPAVSAHPPRSPAAPSSDPASRASQTDHDTSHDKLKAHDVAAVIVPLVTIDEAAAGLRLDKALAAKLAQTGPELSRSRIRSLIEGGQVRLQAAGARPGGTITDPSQRVKPGQSFAIVLPEPAPAVPAAQSLPLTIVYEDAQVLVVDKPAGLVVHPAAGNPDRTLVNALLAHCGPSLSGIGGVRRPGIVHRIDKDTSGLMVVAKTDAAHASLAAQFAAHSLDRAYLALVWGAPEPAEGTVEGAIGRDPRHRQRMAVVGRNGKPALTRYKTMRRFGRVPGTTAPVASLLECRLATGRTHQIRVHMAWLGHPLLGDETYRTVKRGRRQPSRPPVAVAAAAALGRQALHAYRIGFRHPTSGQQLTFESDLPSDFKSLISNLEAI
jgi:23S rRNA pseudouridine1911/1915/1917 synthase